jgi:anti-sigma-K factor RskA
LDLEAYISSGILESYALGAATQQEAIEVESMVAQHPELALELAQIQSALEEYTLIQEQTPPKDLKQKTQEAIFGTGKTEIPKTNFTVTKNEIFNGTQLKWRAAASWALLALSVGANFYFFNQWKNTENKLVVAESQNTQMAQNETILKANYESKIAILNNYDFKKVILKGGDASPNAIASIYFNPKSQEVYLTSMDMPELPAGKEYQLWAIIDNKPVDAGLVAERDSLGKLKLSPNATAFAISLENKGGSTTAEGPKGAVIVVGSV